jgi:hypothetical protein
MFWAGIALLLCLCGAWCYSWQQVVALRHGSLTVMHASGGFTVTHNPFEEKSWEFHRSAPAERVLDIRWSLFQKPYSLAGQGLAASGLKVQPRTLEQWHRSWIATYPGSVSLSFVPDWLIAVSLLLPWAGMIAWRLRRGVEAEPAAWMARAGQLAEAAAAKTKVASVMEPPPVPRRVDLEAARERTSIWANIVPRGVAVVPGSPWNYSGVPPLTDTPMPFKRES